jgi:transposase
MSDELQSRLFEDDPNLPPAPAPSKAPGIARVLLPNRTQLELRPCDLESLLPEGHRARLVWAWVERADLSRMYAGIHAVEGGSGRTAIAPEILFALWLYATLDGVGSARAIARLTQEHDVYRWICGGMTINYHTLSDFRSAHGEALDALLSESVALLLAEGAVTLKRVAQDGARVRASAGAASFRRGATLQACLE